MLQFRGGKWLNWSHSILGWFSTDFRKLKILSQHLLPQSRVREFQGKQVSEQPRYRAGLIPHRSSCLWVWVLPARPRSHWLFQVGAGLNFPLVEQFLILDLGRQSLVLPFCTLPLCGWETCLEMWSPEICVVLWTVGKACSCWEAPCPVSEAVNPHG